MELKLDTSKTYAIALEGGGAKGAYEIGVWKALEQETPDLLLLDIMLPGEDGLTVLKKLRASKSHHREVQNQELQNPA